MVRIRKVLWERTIPGLIDRILSSGLSLGQVGGPKDCLSFISWAKPSDLKAPRAYTGCLQRSGAQRRDRLIEYRYESHLSEIRSHPRCIIQRAGGDLCIWRGSYGRETVVTSTSVAF